MAELQEIVNKEKPRSGHQEFLTIHLYQDGSFYRAYDWSAWLCVNYIKSDMKVTHRKAKTKDIDFAFVGFPITSIEKYTPADAVTIRLSKKAVDIQLDANLIDPSVSFETLSEAVEKWKDGIALNKPSERKTDKERNNEISPRGTDQRLVIQYREGCHSLLGRLSFNTGKVVIRYE